MITNFSIFCESLKNPTLVKSEVKRLLNDIKKITPSIKRDNIKFEDYSKMYWELEIRWLDLKCENKIENLLITRQKELMKNGIVMPYRISKHDTMIFKDDVDNEMGFDLEPSGELEIWLDIFFKDLYTRRISPPKYLYHATAPKNSSSIEKHGLQPIEFNNGNWTKESIRLYYPPTVFASYDEDSHYAGPMDDVWRIDTTGLKNTWWEDLNFYRHNDPEKRKPEYVMTFDPIPPDHLELYKG